MTIDFMGPSADCARWDEEKARLPSIFWSFRRTAQSARRWRASAIALGGHGHDNALAAFDCLARERDMKFASNMKLVTVVTLILIVSVALIHDMAIFTKLIVGSIVFAAWVLFAVGRSAQLRKRAKQSNTSA
ncbi:hypothetical protein [Methylocystis parvus]|uniref:hypothetical protein n=1 Tax=Methylocystis parvus TaxID=134 RepID=UPI003C708747